MVQRIKITSELTKELFSNSILLKYNNPGPAKGVYGWLKEDTEIDLRVPVTIEQNSGLFGGPYKSMVGGYAGSGFATIGAFSYSYSPLPEGISVGRYCSISDGLKFLDSTHPLETLTTSAIMFRPRNNLFKEHFTDAHRNFYRTFQSATLDYPVIGNDVWIGSNVTLSPKITIGTGAVIAANSTVTKDVPPYAIVGGNPSKIIKYRFNEDTIHGLLNSKWWNYDPSQIFEDVSEDFTELLLAIHAGKFAPYKFSSIKLGFSS